MLDLGPPKRYSRRSELFLQGSPLERVFLIEQGFAKLEFATRLGRQATLALRFPGDWAGLCCACLESRCYVSATTLTQALIHEVDARKLLEVSATVPAAANLLRITLAADIKRVSSALLGLKLQSGRDRFEGLLAELASASERKHTGTGVRVPVTDAEIAALISVTPAHLSRIKRELKTEGRFRTKGKTIYIRRRRGSDRSHDLLELG